MHKPKYSDHLDTLIAVVTHIGVGKYVKRTVKGIAADAQLEPQSVAFVLTNFPGLFKKYKDARSLTGDPLYTLHILHAGKWLDNEGDDSRPNRAASAYAKEKVPLDPQHLAVLLEFISHRAQDETQHSIAWRTGWFSLLAGAVGGAIGAAAAIYVGKA